MVRKGVGPKEVLVIMKPYVCMYIALAHTLLSKQCLLAYHAAVAAIVGRRHGGRQRLDGRGNGHT